MSGTEVGNRAQNRNNVPNGSMDDNFGRSATPPEQGADTGAQTSNLQAADVTMDSSAPTKDINDLLNPPPNVAAMRQRLFNVQGKIELKLEEFETYWPFIDNVWVRQHRAGTDKTGRVTTDYYACRLQRPTYTPRNSDKSGPNNPEGKPLRKKQIREGGTCQMRIKTVRVEGGFSGYIITRIGEQEHHTHDLDHMDKIKRNRVVMEIARAEVMKGFMPASVFTIMSENQEKLTAAGGRHLNRNDVRNASQAWRQSYTGELAVHPGYKYDHGNGIVRDIDEAALRAAALNGDVTMIDPTINGTLPTHPTPAIAAVPPLPLGALRFPMPARHFLEPYLLPMNSPVVEGKLPFVTLTYAASMDSLLAIAPGKQSVISGPESKAMTHYLRSRHDAILIGVGTALADDPGLNCRLEGAGGFGGMGWDFQPRPVVIDPAARWILRPDSRILKTVAEGKGRGPWIIMSPDVQMDPTRLEMLKFYGGKYLGLQDMDMHYRLRWEAIFRALAAEGIRSVMVEGGATVINELLQPKYAKLINSVIITVAPTYLGTGGVSVCPPRPTDLTGQPKPVTRFQDVRWQPLGEDVVMCGRLKG
ncbi:MAG: 2,5-diamino-6-(ribosylamino)-4(3H)-pyrimidinone 5'-phosphate reductase [Icmadophila ericetorum]|nr:2,5-diamino-6-(ribosylamino)-4(3H)-pyrimidinone 5'-phosphate reductase [Icmadophila ericetorum]